MTIYSHINLHAENPEEDLVFKALANPSRRRILDIIGMAPGITQGDISGHFDMSRFGVRSHVAVLMEAGLVTIESEGRERRHYLNAVPIQTVYDRWLTEHSARWASTLTSLKYGLEAMPEPRHRYEVYIRTTPEALWNAITNGKVTPSYYYGAQLETSLEPGSPFLYKHHEDASIVMISGEVLECVPLKKLVHTFDFMKGDGPSTVTYEIEAMGDVCKLTLVHTFEKEDETFRSVQNGWNPILSGLKTLLETGKVLTIPMS